MAQAVVVTYGEVPVEGRAAVPVYVDNSLPAVGPARNVIVVPASYTRAGGPPQPVVNMTGTMPGLGPAMPVYVVSGVLDTLAYTTKVKNSGPIAYWTLSEASGTTITDASGNGRTGTYANVTLAQPGIGDGRTAASFNGTTSSGNVFGASLAGAFSGTTGTLMCWLQVSSAGVWTDGTARYAVELNADASNRISILRSTTNNTLTLAYRGGNVLKQVNIGSLSSTDWLAVAITWDTGADQVKAYIGGTQSGATQTTLTPFAGALAVAIIGAQTLVPAAVWSGTLAHVALWTRALSATEIATLATVASP